MVRKVKYVNKRIIGLDIIKFLSACMIVCMHTLRKINPDVPNLPFLYYGARCAIPLFFMSLGYIQLNKKNFELKYALTKIKNIIVVVLIWIILYDVFMKVTNVKHDFFVDIFGWTIQRGSYSIFWFMFSLCLIYIITWGYFKIRKKYNIGEVKVLAFLLPICLCSSVINVIDLISNNNMWQSIIPQSLRIWTWLLYYFIGGIVQRYKVNNKKILICNLVLSSVIAVIYQYFFCYKLTHIINSEYMYDHIFIIWWCCSIFMFFINIDIKNNTINNIIINLSGCLLSIYALHIPIIKVLKSVIRHSNAYMEILYCFMVLSVCIILGLIMKKIPLIKKLTSI